MTKIADSYFIDSDTGKKIPVRMEYSGVFKPDTTMITAHNVYRLNNGVAEKLDGSGWRQPNTDDPNYWKTNIRQAAKNQEEPLNSVKYYWNKFTNWIKEDKNGGNMNYASYLQGGGAAPLNAAPLVSKEDIAEVITAALNGTGETKQKATAALQEMMQDASLAPLVEQVMSEMGISSLKCGGRVKKKEMGSKLVKAEKAKCGCALKKVGGRLVEVDTCTGLPIHRNGGHILYAKPGDKIPENNTSRAAKAYIGAELYDFNFVNPFSSWKEFQRQVGYPVEWAWNGIKKIGEKLDNSEFGKWAMKDYPREATPVVKPSTAPKTELEMQQMIQASQAGVRALLPVQQPPVVEQPVVEIPTNNVSKYTPLFSGDLRSYGARRQWVTDNAEYLKSQGWDDARIAGYRGSAADNIALQKAISGKSAWDAEQEVQAAQAQRVGTFYSKMSDSDKRALQDMLKSAGYYKGEINGLIDNVVLDALRKFQQDNKLTVDGMAGRNTFDVLRAKTRQVAQPVIDPTAVPGYTQAMQLLNQMNGSASAAPVKTGRPTGGMGLNDVHQGRDVQLVGPKVGLNLTAGLEIPQRKQGGQLNYANYLN